MRKVVVILLVGGMAVSCVTTTKVYRNPNYKMSKKDTVYIEKSRSSYIYSDAQLQNEGSIVTAVPDKQVASLYRVDSSLYKELKALRYRPMIVEKGWSNPKKGLVISYKDYWVNEKDPAFFRFWLKGMSLKDSAVTMVYEGAPIPSTDTKPSPEKEIKRSILELITPGMEQEPDENDFYLTEDETMLPKSKYYAAVSYGTAKMFGNSYNNVLPSEKDYKESLTKGTALSGELGYFFTPFYGAGVSVSSFTSAKKSATITSEDPNTAPRHLSDQIHILYVGPAFYARNLMFKGRFSSILSVSGGYLKYTDDQKVFTSDTFETGVSNSISASGLGAKLGLSLEYKVHQYVGVGLNGGLALGRLEVTDKMAPSDEQTQKLWMNHFTLGFGVRFYY
ncbi:hypothetical protein [uncultured Acetobacteroides sp.]|uniref:hypothetical protein n=1 Tax=uncultured Acetobacteroides sp. TaxID=1760811 RepID=UPI0029F5BDF2|nr:hypothetical protein [uncultured Acetobacteroides sp.]